MRRAQHPLVARAIALGVTDERVLEAVRQIPRVAFVPPAARRVADRDAPIPIGHGQTTSQPSLIAHVVAELELRPSDRVLEVGAGLGYQTAILASVADHVFSIDRFDDLVAAARGNLAAQGIHNVTLTTGDGTEGWPEPITIAWYLPVICGTDPPFGRWKLVLPRFAHPVALVHIE